MEALDSLVIGWAEASMITGTVHGIYYELRFGWFADDTSGPFVAKSASKRTDDWPLWCIGEINNPDKNVLRMPRENFPDAIFTNRLICEAIAADANRQIQQ